MPIHPENRARYPKEWKSISSRIRFERAGNRCECQGECARGHTERCDMVNGGQSVTGARVVLTVAHLNHTPEDCRDENLRAMCQACHLAYDRDHHAESRRRRRIVAGGKIPPELLKLGVAEGAGHTALPLTHPSEQAERGLALKPTQLCIGGNR